MSAKVVNCTVTEIQLLFALREQAGREASPTAAIIDSQSLKSAEKGVQKK